MNTVVAFLLIWTLCHCFVPTGSLKCWSCSTWSGKRINGSSNPNFWLKCGQSLSTGVTVTEKKKFLIDCNTQKPGGEIKSTVRGSDSGAVAPKKKWDRCWTQTQLVNYTGDTTLLVSRSCGSDSTELKDTTYTCYSMKRSGFRGTDCSCTADGCNGLAGQEVIYSSGLLVVALSFVSIFASI